MATTTCSPSACTLACTWAKVAASFKGLALLLVPKMVPPRCKMPRHRPAQRPCLRLRGHQAFKTVGNAQHLALAIADQGFGHGADRRRSVRGSRRRR